MSEQRPFSEWNFDELAAEAQTGRRGQGAVVESMRRLITAVQSSSDSADSLASQVIRLTNTLRVLTWLLVGVAILQLVVAVVQVALMLKGQG